MYQANVVASPSFLIWIIKNEDAVGFTAYGSRKIDLLNLEVDYGYKDMGFFGSPFASGGFFGPVSYNMSTSVRGFTVVQGKTELEAIFSLITALQEEELAEQKEAIRQAAEKLRIKEEKKNHKKYKKQRAEGKFDTHCTPGCSLCEKESLEAFRRAHDDGICEPECDYCLDDDYYGCECCR